MERDGRMKRSRFTEEQIIAILREQEAGVPAAELSRKHGLSSPTFYPCIVSDPPGASYEFRSDMDSWPDERFRARHWRAKRNRAGSRGLCTTLCQWQGARLICRPYFDSV